MRLTVIAERMGTSKLMIRINPQRALPAQMDPNKGVTEVEILDDTIRSGDYPPPTKSTPSMKTGRERYRSE